MASERAHEKYETVIGLEVHAQLQTQSKIFCGDATAFGQSPNAQISPISLAYPGTLPKLNRRAVELAIRMGLACQSRIAETMFFDRKNYFYPDLPKGYQITQDRAPVCRGGHVTIEIDSVRKKISLNRIHLEEDAGKLIHDADEAHSLIDLNRAGTPLIEIVTEPVLHSPEEAGALLAELRKLVRHLGICDGNMEEGSLRCDANVSVRLRGASALGRKVEIKNMNSIRNVQRAIAHEVARQVDLLETGDTIVSETRMFNAETGKSYSMRMKEELNDYRYFPDPDLSPVVITNAWLDEIRQNMPELPSSLLARIRQQYHLPAYDATVLTESQELADLFEQICRYTKNYKAAANWVMGPVKSYLNEHGIRPAYFAVPPEKIGSLIAAIDDGKVSFTAAAQQLLPRLITDPAVDVLEMAKGLNLLQESDDGVLEQLVSEVIREFPLKVEEYHNGKKAIVTMFMGEVMKRSKGKADPKKSNALILEKLKKK